ncbi:Asp23/Gls24 family envelope stress response protein [Plantibacter flavus]|uniref:Asp23/Gls24 family envelope stress response protein n=1 Tax=Plantibacter flavus TaxID=150123 RepID=UPI003F14CF25
MHRFQSDPDATAGGEEVPGTTTVQDSVVGKVIGLSASRVSGVYALGDVTTRAIGVLREVLGQADLSQGVSVTNDDGTISVQAVIVVEYPHPVQEVAAEVRSEIANAITVLLGMTIGEIDVTVNDVHVTEIDPVDADAANQTTETTTEETPR